MAVFSEILRDIPFIDFMAHPNICCKDVVGFPEQFQSVTHWRSEKLRMVTRHKVFIAAIIANGLQPGSICLQSEVKFCRVHYVADEAVFESNTRPWVSFIIKCLTSG